jgi:hypothetical protein
MTKKNRAMLDAIQALAARDLDEASDEQIRAEFVEDKRDPSEVACNVANSLDMVVARFMREHAAANKSRPNANSRTALRIPAVERIRELIQNAFSREPELAAAFRDGKKQSENDMVSLYEDLVELGKIEPEDGTR